MSRPPINPQKTVAGIIVDPQTLERVIPESNRPDGTVRPKIKIRPGYTPQEDVSRFRGTRQAQMDANTLPKGHIIGWAPPLQSTAASASVTKPMSKSAKKNAKRREKKAEKQETPESWDGDDEGNEGQDSNAKDSCKGDSVVEPDASLQHPPDRPNWAIAPAPDPAKTPPARSPTKSTPTADALASDLEKMTVQ